jgi:hypothetical protein
VRGGWQEPGLCPRVDSGGCDFGETCLPGLPGQVVIDRRLSLSLLRGFSAVSFSGGGVDISLCGAEYRRLASADGIAPTC